MLRGIGVTMGLPWLEAMGDVGSVARAAGGAGGAGGATAAATPLRMAMIFTPNGVNYPHWLPKGEGREWELSPTLEPLGAVREHVNVLTGLTLDKARANGDGPGDHARSSASFLTGQQARKTAGNDISLGVSVDQFAAEQVGGATRLASLEIGCENGRRAGNCDSGYSCAYSSNISWKDEDTPVPKLVDPAAVFERMFGDASKTADETRRRRWRASVLDYLQDDTRMLEKRLGRADRRKLDEFRESVREVERRVQVAQSQRDQAPSPDPKLAPVGVPEQVSEHIDLMYDMLRLAFQMDATRIATFMVGTGGSNRTFPEIGIREGHHHLSHHQENQEMIEKIRRIDRFYIERFARFVDEMARTSEGEGSLLDHCMILHGSGICDGNRHNHENLPIVMAGRGLGGAHAEPAIESGRLVDYGRETPLCGLYMSMLGRMGCEVESFGDATAPLSV